MSTESTQTFQTYDSLSDTHVTFDVTPSQHARGRLSIVVSITPGQKNREFQFWKATARPVGDGYYSLMVIPDYHPCMQDGRVSRHMINGATDALATGNLPSISVLPPAGSQRDELSFFGHWPHLNHPIVARGQSFALECDHDALLSSRNDETREILASLVSAALGANGDYVSISGGFRPPSRYRYPQKTEQHTRVTGAEHSMAWQHHVLTAEGTITDAYVPEWFVKGGWLDYYENARQSEHVAIEA